MLIDIALLFSVVSAIVMALETKNLMRTAIFFGVASALLSAVFFIAGAPIAAAFELVVGAGLITVLFISAVSMTKQGGDE